MNNEKDLVDQTIDQIKLVSLLNTHDPTDAFHILRSRTAFYYKEHLFVVSDLYGPNLYDVCSQVHDNTGTPEHIKTLKGATYFSLRVIRKVCKKMSLLPPLTLIGSGWPLWLSCCIYFSYKYKYASQRHVVFLFQFLFLLPLSLYLHRVFSFLLYVPSPFPSPLSLSLSHRSLVNFLLLYGIFVVSVFFTLILNQRMCC